MKAGDAAVQKTGVEKYIWWGGKGYHKGSEQDWAPGILTELFQQNPQRPNSVASACHRQNNIFA